MKVRIYIIICFLLHLQVNVHAQQVQINLSPRSDTVINSFTVFSVGKSDSKSDIEWKTPKSDSILFTVSRSLYLKSIDKNLGILIGQNKLLEKFIIFDSNMNQDFADDEIIHFPDTVNSSSNGNYKTFSARIKNTAGKFFDISFDYTIIKPKALFLDYGDSLENHFFFAYRSRNYFTGQAMFKGKNFFFYLIPKKPLDFTRTSVKLFVTDSIIDLKTHNFKQNEFRVGDKIAIGKEYYAINKITGEGLQMHLAKITDEKPVGINVGFFVPDLSFTTIENSTYKLSAFKTKYVLLEFWGTWCGPCKVILPGLQLLFESNKEKTLSIISIAYNDKRELVLKHKENNNITWPQVLNASGGNKNFSSLYEIEGYPGFLLIDTSGKIVFRDFGITGFDNLRTFLQSNSK